MRLPLSLAFGATLIGASMVGGLASPPASAAPVAAVFSQEQLNLSGNDPLVVQIQARRHHRRGHYRGGRGGSAAGAAAAGIIGGLFLGAIIANEAQRQDAISYCMRRFRSYDPYSMTYLGYDGRRHPCP